MSSPDYVEIVKPVDERPEETLEARLAIWREFPLLHRVCCRDGCVPMCRLSKEK